MNATTKQEIESKLMQSSQQVVGPELDYFVQPSPSPDEHTTIVAGVVDGNGGNNRKLKIGVMSKKPGTEILTVWAFGCN